MSDLSMVFLGLTIAGIILVLPVVLLIVLVSMRSRIKALEGRVDQLTRRLDGAPPVANAPAFASAPPQASSPPVRAPMPAQWSPPPRPAPASPAAAAPPPVPPPPAPEPIAPKAVAPSAEELASAAQAAYERYAAQQRPQRPEAAAPAAQPSAPAPAAPAAPAMPAPPAAPRAPRRKIDWEIFAGGRLFSIIGAIMVIVGGGLLAKYAIDHGWFPPSLYGAFARVVYGFVIGGALLFAGDRSQRATKKSGERSWFGQALTGAGLGTLYVAGYGAWGSAHAVPPLASFAIMSVVTGIAFALAVRYDALAIALIGWFGAFATPFVIADPNANEAGLAIYLVSLDLGLAFAALRKKTWFVLQPLALAATALVSALWFGRHAGEDAWYVDAIALASIWAIFFATGLFTRLRESRAATLLEAFGEIANTAIFWTFASVALASQKHALESLFFLSTLALAAGYVSVARRTGDRLARGTYSTLALVGAFVFTNLCVPELTDRAIVLFVGALAIAGFATLRARTPQSIGEAFAAACATYGYALLVSLAGARETWNFTGTPLGATLREGDLAILCAIASAFVLDALLARRLSVAIGGRALRLAGTAEMLGAVSAHFAGFDLAIGYALLATLGAAAARIGRKRAGTYPGLKEAPFTSGATLLLAALVDAATPQTLVHDGIVRSDLALEVIIGALFVYERLSRDLFARFPEVSMFLRASAVALSVLLSFEHAHGASLTTALALEAIVLAFADRALARFGGLFGSPSERYGTGIALLVTGALALVRVPDAVTYRGSSFDLTYGGADLALLALMGACALFAYLASRAGLGKIAIGARALGTIVLLAATPAHAHEGGLASAYGLEAIAWAALAFWSARTAASRAVDVETVLRAGVFAAAASLAYATVTDALVYRGTFAFGINGLDTALAIVLIAWLAVSRASLASAVDRIATIAARQIAIAVGVFATYAHASGGNFIAVFAVGALAFVALAFNARRNADDRARREYTIDAALATAVADIAILAQSQTWNVEHLVRFQPIFNERFPAILLAALATGAVAWFARRVKAIGPRVSLGARAVGIAYAILAFTLDVRDGFGAAIVRATNDGQAPDAIARLANLQEVTISVVWIAVSLLLIALGIRLRARDLRLFAIGLFDLTILKAFFVDLAGGGALVRIVAFIALGLVLLGVSYVYQRYERRMMEPNAADPPLEPSPTA